jgi:hypothetical protein
VARVHEPSGYVDTWIQGVAPEKKFAALEWTHEMHLAGHLIQAAVELVRAAVTAIPVLDLEQPRPRPDAGLASASSSLRHAMTNTQLMGRQ